MRTAFILLLFACIQSTSPQTGAGEKSKCPLDQSRMVVFNELRQYLNFFGEDVELNNIEIAELERVECLLREVLKQEYKGSSPVDLDQAYRQYQSGKRKNGDVVVYINGFCRVEDERWRQDWIFVLDGGSCYWRSVVNLTQGKVERLDINGFG